MKRSRALPRIFVGMLIVIMMSGGLHPAAQVSLAVAPPALDAVPGAQPAGGPAAAPGGAVDPTLSWLGMSAGTRGSVTIARAQDCVDPAADVTPTADTVFCDAVVEEPPVDAAPEDVVEIATEEVGVEPTAAPVIDATTEPEPTIEQPTDPPVDVTSEPTTEATVEATAEATTEPTADVAHPAVTVALTVTSDGTTAISTAKSGDTVIVSFVITNTGDTPLIGVAVSDPGGAVSGCAAELPAGEATTCQRSRALGDTDVPGITLTADVVASAPDGAVVSNQATFNLTVDEAGTVHEAATGSDGEGETLANIPNPAVIYPGVRAHFDVSLTYVQTDPECEFCSDAAAIRDTLPVGFNWTIDINAGTTCVTIEQGEFATFLSDGAVVPGGTLIQCGVWDGSTFGDLFTGDSIGFSITSTTAPDCTVVPEIPNTAESWYIGDGDFFQYSVTDSAVTACPDVSAAKSGNGPVNAGETAIYTITLTAGGSDASDNTTITDTLPAGITWSIDRIIGGTYDGPPCDITSGTLSCFFGTLSPGTTRTVIVSGTTDPSDCGTLSNTATVGATTDVDTTNNSATARIDVRCPNLWIDKYELVDDINSGEDAEFQIEFGNNGAGTATDVFVSDDLPDYPSITWRIEPAVPGCGIGVISVSGQVLQCSFDTLDNETTIAVTVVGTVPDSFCGDITNNGASISGTNEPSGSLADNDSDSATVTVLCPRLSISKGPDLGDENSVISAGEDARFLITVNNTGAGIAKNVIVYDTLPPGSWSAKPSVGSCGSQDNGAIQCDLGDLDSFDFATVEVIRQTAVADCGTLTNSAEVGADNTDRETLPSDSGAITVLCPNLAVSKSTPDGTLDAGEVATYVISVTNGDSTKGSAFDVVLTDSLPSGVTWQAAADPAPSGEGLGCSIDPATNLLTCNLGNVPGGGAYTISVTGTTDAGECTSGLTGTLSNTATVDSAYTTPVTSGSATLITVNCPDLTVSKSTTTESVESGDPINYTITVTNGGPGAATGVTLSDQLPTTTGLTWAVNPAVGTCAVDGGGLLSCPALGTLAAGAQVAVTVTATVPSTFCGPLTNQAASVSATNEPAGAIANNTSNTSRITVRCPDLVVSKATSTESVESGDAIDYSITVTNEGDGKATGVTLSDQLPVVAGLVWTVDPAVASCAVDGSGMLDCTALGTLAAGASLTVTVTATVPTDYCGPLTNEGAAAAAANEPGGAAENNASNPVTIDVRCPDVTVSKSTTTPSVDSGDTVSYTLTVSNAGPGKATNVTLRDQLPVAQDLVWSVNPAVATCAVDAGSLLTCTDLGSLAAGASLTVIVTATVPNAFCGDLLNQQARTDAANELEADRTNNLSGTALITVRCPSLAIVKRADAATINSTERASYTIEVTNGGPGKAVVVVLTDTLDAGTWDVTAPVGWTCSTGGAPVADSAAFQAADSFTCERAALAPTTAPETFTVARATGLAECTTLTNAATVGAANNATVGATADVLVQCPALSVVKSPDGDAINAGEPMAFTIEVANAGPGTAIGTVELSDSPLPPGEWNVTAPEGWSCSVGGVPVADSAAFLASGDFSCAVDTLAPTGDTPAVFTVERTALLDDCDPETDTGSFTNSAAVTAGNDEGDDDTGAIAVNCPDLTITTTVSPAGGTIGSGDPVTFTVTVTNNGPGVATGVQLTDTLVGGVFVQGAELTAVPVCTVGDTEATCDFGEMLPGESQSVELTATTDDFQCGTLTSTATVTVSNPADQADAGDTVQTVLDVTCPASLTVTKTASLATAAPGDEITYTYVITNDGEDVLTDVSVDDDLGTPGFAADDETVCTIPVLNPNEPGTVCFLTVEVTADQAGAPLTNVVTVRANARDTGIVVETSAEATVTIAEAVAPCSFPVTFTFVSDVVFRATDGSVLFTINAGSTLTFPNGNQQGAGCQSNNWEFNGRINGVGVSFKFKGFLGEQGSTAAAGVRALPSLATSDLVLEITEVDNIDWDIAGLPAPQAPVTVQLSTRPSGAKIEAGGGSAEVSISPELEIPFTTVSEYQIGKAALPTVGTGLGAPRAPSNLPLGLLTALPVLLLALRARSRERAGRRRA